MPLNQAARFVSSVIYPISRFINFVGAGVLTAMMLLTAVDVILRYVFNRPITGSLELTEFMMAIVVAFGLAYTAVHKGHIIIEVVVGRLPARTQAVINSINSLISLVIFSLITWQSITYAESIKAGGYTSAGLLIPKYPFIYVVAFGSAILCLVFLVNLFEHLAQAVAGSRQAKAGLLSGLVLIVLLFAVSIWGRGPLHVSPITAGIFGTAALIVLLFSGMPIGVVMGLIGFLGMTYVSGLGAGIGMMGTSPYSTLAAYLFSVIPLFVLMGDLCFHAGLSGDLYSMAYKWLGHLPGGLAVATIGACTGFAAVTGSSTACVATIGSVALPEMRKYKYDSALATGCIAAGGGLGILIPPSTIMVIYCILTEQSIGKLFLAGFIPGIMQAIFYMITIYILCRRNPLMGPPGAVTNFKERLISLQESWVVLALFLLVIGGLYLGVFTPVEAAGVGAFGALIFAIGKRKLKWKNFTESLLDTGKTTAMIFFILIGAMLLTYFMAVTRLPFQLANFMAGLEVNRYIIIVAIMVIYLVLGAFMSPTAMIVLTVPIFFPIITALGFDPIWFGIMVVIVVEVGMITPPYAINVFVMQGVAKDVPMYTVFRGIWPFFYANLFLIALLVASPQIVTFLPDMMKK